MMERHMEDQLPKTTIEFGIALDKEAIAELDNTQGYTQETVNWEQEDQQETEYPAIPQQYIDKNLAQAGGRQMQAARREDKQSQTMAGSAGRELKEEWADTVDHLVG